MLPDYPDYAECPICSGKALKSSKNFCDRTFAKFINQAFFRFRAQVFQQNRILRIIRMGTMRIQIVTHGLFFQTPKGLNDLHSYMPPYHKVDEVKLRILLLLLFKQTQSTSLFNFIVTNQCGQMRHKKRKNKILILSVFINNSYLFSASLNHAAAQSTTTKTTD